MTRVLLLDTNVFSHLVLGSEPKRAAVKAGLVALLQQYPDAKQATSGLCVAECLVAARRIMDEPARSAAEAAFAAMFGAPGMQVIAVSAQVLDRAAALRAEALRRAAQSSQPPASADGGRLKLPDAIVAASCLGFDPPAVLVTENVGDFTWNDAQGKQVKTGGLEVVKIG